MFPFLIGKVLTIKSTYTCNRTIVINVLFPFLIGKVLTNMTFRKAISAIMFPFLIGKVLTF